LRKKLAYLLGVLLALLLVTAACFALTYRIIDHRSAREDLRQADVILVLGSAVWPNQQPSPSLRARTERAIELYQEGYAPHLLLSGGLGRYPPEESEVMRRLAVAAGIPGEALILDQQAGSTRDSITTAEEIMDQQGWETALIVSDPFHIQRALLMAEDAGFEAYGVPALQSPTYTVPARRGFYTAREVLALWYYLLQRPFN
jgi:vancomycin permeability regulator SanA